MLISEYNRGLIPGQSGESVPKRGSRCKRSRQAHPSRTRKPVNDSPHYNWSTGITLDGNMIPVLIFLSEPSRKSVKDSRQENPSRTAVKKICQGQPSRTPNSTTMYSTGTTLIGSVRTVWFLCSYSNGPQVFVRSWLASLL